MNFGIGGGALKSVSPSVFIISEADIMLLPQISYLPKVN